MEESIKYTANIQPLVRPRPVGILGKTPRTHSNPADGLSRAGMEDAWTLQQGWTLQELDMQTMRIAQYFLNSEPVKQMIGMNRNWERSLG